MATQRYRVTVLTAWDQSVSFVVTNQLSAVAKSALSAYHYKRVAIIPARVWLTRGKPVWLRLLWSSPNVLEDQLNPTVSVFELGQARVGVCAIRRFRFGL